MLLKQMLLIIFEFRELIARVTAFDRADIASQNLKLFENNPIDVVNSLILLIHKGLILEFTFKPIPSQRMVTRDDQFLQLLLANSALIVLYQEPDPELADHAHVFMVTHAHGEIFQFFRAEDAAFEVVEVDSGEVV
jgi:hypothetical protein